MQTMHMNWKPPSLTLITAAVGLCAWLAIMATAGAAQADLQGTWREAAQGHTIEIAPCAERAETLCARVLADHPERGQKSRAGAVVARALTATQAQQWSGEFLGPGGQRFPLQIMLADTERLTYKVCVLPRLCNGGAYTRVAP